MTFLKKESDRLATSREELERRRLNWRMVTQEKIETKFHAIADEAHKVNYPFRLYCTVNNLAINEATVQLSSAANKTGVIEKIDSPNSKGSTSEMEKGSALVASFSSIGNIAFIIYPYRSERFHRNEENIILYVNMSPDDGTEKLIDKCISKYFLYIRHSSVHGVYSSSSFLDIMKLNWMILIDVRNRRKLLKSFFSILLEWSKIIGAGIAGYIVAILTK